MAGKKYSEGLLKSTSLISPHHHKKDLRSSEAVLQSSEVNLQSSEAILRSSEAVLRTSEAILRSFHNHLLNNT